jgi:hypothetical protein
VSLSDVLTLIVAVLALIVSVGKVLYDIRQDRPRVEIHLSTLGSDAMGVSVVNAGDRSLYLTFVGFAKGGAGVNLDAFVDDVLDAPSDANEVIAQSKRVEALQPWQQVEYTVPAELLQRRLSQGFKWIAVHDSRRKYRQKVPSWVIAELAPSPAARTNR